MIINTMDKITEAMADMQVDRKYDRTDLRALIKGANVVYSNAEIRNLTETKISGSEYDIRISSSD